MAGMMSAWLGLKPGSAPGPKAAAAATAAKPKPKPKAEPKKKKKNPAKPTPASQPAPASLGPNKNSMKRTAEKAGLAAADDDEAAGAKAAAPQFVQRKLSFGGTLAARFVRGPAVVGHPLPPPPLQPS